MKRSIIKLAGFMAFILGSTSVSALVVGDQVPDISVPSTSGTDLNLRSMEGVWKVVFFYPKSFTPGCTRQACGMRDSKAALDELGVVVVGISTDTMKSQLDFKKKHELPFDLLADESKELSRAFGVLGLMGMTKRSTFIVDPKGMITDVIESVSVGSHETDVLTILKKRLDPTAE